MNKLSNIDRLKKQREVINARIQSAQNREQERNRKHETRRKIILGTYYLEQAEKDNNFDSLKKIMDSYLTKDIDRKLFDLPPIKSKS
jgi:large subunit ribosomal protein L7/L12